MQYSAGMLAASTPVHNSYILMVGLISYVKSVVYLHLSECGLLFVNVFLLEKLRKTERMSADYKDSGLKPLCAKRKWLFRNVDCL